TAPDFDGAHLRQINAALAELADALAARGGTLVTRVGDVPDVFERLRAEVTIAALHSHEETTQAVAYARDRAVRRWARAHGIPWHETPQTGVVRRLPSRDAWAALYDARMAAPPVPAPEHVSGVPVASDGLLTADALRARGVNAPDDSHPLFTPGGERVARRTLASCARLVQSHQRTSGHRDAEHSPGVARRGRAARVVACGAPSGGHRGRPLVAGAAVVRGAVALALPLHAEARR
ncbi:MAG: deoxyribodipyrimidine photo-lyase, partial [Gemmatimonadaceae bacterium]|nr:deoxyribodipyrimidine photo-lyase [Gemmatimonadaceae bacterium]